MENPRRLFHIREQVLVGLPNCVPEEEGKDTMNRANIFLEKKITESSTVWQKQRPLYVEEDKKQRTCSKNAMHYRRA